jgi:alcohol dehydrogenase class IV
MGVTDERLDELSEMAAQDPTAGGNPIPVGAAEMKQMFVAAIEGRLP